MDSSRIKIEAPVKIQYLANRQELIPVIARWIYNEWSFLYTGKSRKYVESLLKERLHKKLLPLTLVAFIGEKPAGTVSLKEFDLETRKDLTPWVASLFVAERWRGRGIGSSLMKAVEQKAANLGMHRLYLFTADSDLAARFYSGLGWKIKQRTSYQSYRIIIMEKEMPRNRPLASDSGRFPTEKRSDHL